MKPVKTFSPVVYAVMMSLGVVVFLGLMFVAWTSDAPEVGLALEFKVKITAAAVVLGGGLCVYARKYKRDAF